MLRSTGEVTDRPWGVTLAELGKAQFTGVLTLASDTKEHSISFDLGRVVGATSPLASDAAVRVALTNHLVSSSQVVDFNRRIAAAGDRDEVEVLAELAQLTLEVAEKLRHRLVAQRAARTFSIDRGTYTADERIAMPPGCDLDVREVIYLGARMNLSEQRLVGAVRSFGASFRIKPEAIPLDTFGFTDEEEPVIDSLIRGASIPELEVAHRDVDPRMLQAIVYALLSSGACHMKRTASASIEYGDGPELTPTIATEGTYSVSRTQTGERASTVDPPRARAARDTGSSLRTPAPPPVDDGVPRIPVGRRGRSTDSPIAPARAPTPAPVIARTPTGEPIRSRPPTSDPTGFRSASSDPVTSRAATPKPGPGSARGVGLPTIPKPPRGMVPTGPSPAVARTATGQPATSRTETSDPAVARTASGRPLVARTSTARKAQALIAARMILVDQAADHFTLLGVPFDAPTDVVQTAYLNLVRQLHPDKLEELGVPDLTGNAQRLFQQIGLAFSVLTDPVRRADYIGKVAAPPPMVEVTSRTRTADDIAATPAGDAYRRGESALRRDEPTEAVSEFARACALEPNNVDFHAMLGWAQFCAARDKVTIAPETRKSLERAIQRSAKPTHARFLLGRVERMLGRDREALRIFQEVVEGTPGHAEARAEIRAIEARLATSSKR